MHTILRILGWLVTTIVILFAIGLGLKFSQGYQILGGDIITGYGINIICLVGINILLAVSLNLINGYTGQFSLGHAGFMAIGGYSAAFITYLLLHNRSQDNSLFQVLALVGALVVGAIVSALAGLVVGIPSLRLKGDYLAIVTLGFGEIIRLIIENINSLGGVPIGGQRGFFGVPRFPNLAWTRFPSLSLEAPNVDVLWIYLFVVITIIIIHNIANSSYGRSLIAIRENEIAAEAMGINTARYKVIAFTISAALAGVAGGLFAHQQGELVAKTFNFVRSVEIIVMIVCGGMGSITGSILGAIVLTVLPEWLREFKELRMIIYSVLLIVIMIARPQGILGHRELSLQWLRKRFRRAGADVPGVKLQAASAEEAKKS